MTVAAGSIDCRFSDCRNIYIIIYMRTKFLGLMLLCGGMAFAQTADPVIMKING